MWTIVWTARERFGTIPAMTMTAYEMGKKSAAARLKKHGGKKGFAKHMQAISRARRTLDRTAIPKRSA